MIKSVFVVFCSSIIWENCYFNIYHLMSLIFGFLTADTYQHVVPAFVGMVRAMCLAYDSCSSVPLFCSFFPSGTQTTKVGDRVVGGGKLTYHSFRPIIYPSMVPHINALSDPTSIAQSCVKDHRLDDVENAELNLPSVRGESDRIFLVVGTIYEWQKVQTPCKKKDTEEGGLKIELSLHQLQSVLSVVSKLFLFSHMYLSLLLKVMLNKKHKLLFFIVF